MLCKTLGEAQADSVRFGKRGKLHSIARVRKAIMLCKTLAEVQADSVRRLKRIQRFFQNFLPASKDHVGHIEGFQLIVKLLRLRERGDGAVQMQPDALRAPCSRAHS